MGKKSHKHNKNTEDSREQEGHSEQTIDFSAVGDKIKQIGKGISWLKKNVFTGTVTLWLLILIVMFVCIYVRMGPATLPITDQWAQSTVISNLQSNIDYQIRAQRPDLPDASVQQLVQSQLNTVYAQNKDQIDAQIELLSLQFKAELQNDQGLTHILGIDEYLWYSYANWYDKTGYYGTEIVDGTPRFMLRYGRLGQTYYFIFPSYSINLLHDFLKLFDHTRTIEQTAFYISIILMAIVCIPAFFLGRKIAGNTGGFFAAMLIAVSATLVGRTLVGAPESDSYTVLFPLLITLLFFEALTAKNLTKTILLSAGMGLAGALFFFFWGGWWFTFLLIIGMAVVYIVYYAFLRKNNNEKIFGKEFIREIIIPVVFFVSLMLFAVIISLSTGRAVGGVLGEIVDAPLAPINYIIGFKAAAEGNVIGENYALWPNVLRTVAELNPVSLRNVIAGPGSLNLGSVSIRIFWIGLIGILLFFTRYKENPMYPFYGAFLLAWLASTVYAGTTAVRFMVLVDLVIAFGIAHLAAYVVGPALNSIAKTMTANSKEILKWAFLIVLFFALLWSPIKTAKATGDSGVPIFDDAWYESMDAIVADTANSTEKAIITSWWDYGHFFQAETGQTVTFDGGDQGKRIYWVGKTLVTSDEYETVDILKMLNCGEEESYNLLENYTGDRMHATQLMLTITREDREDASATLLDAGLTEEQTESVLAYSHCSDLYSMYFVTSEDMVGKASVWGYFGSWDFNKAYFYYYLRNLDLPEAIAHAEEDLGYDMNTTKALYNQAKKLETENAAASWISTYPGYATENAVTCSKEEDKDVVSCSYNLVLSQQTNVNVVLTKGIINLTQENNSVFILQAINTQTGSVVQQSALIPSAIVLDKNGELERVELDNANFGYDVVLYQVDGTYQSLVAHPYLSQSVFTKLFYMDGQYTTHFEKISDITSFRGERIIVWKVNP